jgi:hypothetical protein
MLIKIQENKYIQSHNVEFISLVPGRGINIETTSGKEYGINITDDALFTALVDGINNNTDVDLTGGS